MGNRHGKDKNEQERQRKEDFFTHLLNLMLNRKIIQLDECFKDRGNRKGKVDDYLKDINIQLDVFTCKCGKHNTDDFSLLHYAASKCTPLVVIALVQYDADVNLKTSSRLTPLMLAAIHGNEENILTLISLKAEKDAVDEMSNTALHLACLHGHVAVVEELINRKVNAGIRNRYNLLPIDLAQQDQCKDEEDYKQIFQLLKDYENPQTSKRDPSGKDVKETLDKLNAGVQDIRDQLAKNMAREYSGNNFKKKGGKFPTQNPESSHSNSEEEYSLHTKPIQQGTDSGIDLRGNLYEAGVNGWGRGMAQRKCKSTFDVRK